MPSKGSFNPTTRVPFLSLSLSLFRLYMHMPLNVKFKSSFVEGGPVALRCRFEAEKRISQERERGFRQSTPARHGLEGREKAKTREGGRQEENKSPSSPPPPLLPYFQRALFYLCACLRASFRPDSWSGSTSPEQVRQVCRLVLRVRVNQTRRALIVAMHVGNDRSSCCLPEGTIPSALACDRCVVSARVPAFLPRAAMCLLRVASELF